MTDPDKPTASEVRVRREVRALVWPLAAGVAFTIGVVATTKPWSVVLYGLFAALCLARWQHDRPKLPGDSSTSLFTAIHAAPWMFVLTVFSAVTFGVGVTTAVLSPEQWWPWPVLIVGVGSTVWLGCLLVFGRRNYERAREAA